MPHPSSTPHVLRAQSTSSVIVFAVLGSRSVRSSDGFLLTTALAIADALSARVKSLLAFLDFAFFTTLNQRSRISPRSNDAPEYANVVWPGVAAIHHVVHCSQPILRSHVPLSLSKQNARS